MGRKKRIDFFRSVFTITVEDSVVFPKEFGIKSLETKTSHGGVSFIVQRLSYDTFRVISRSYFLKYALMDNRYLRDAFKRDYNGITEVKIQGRYITGGTVKWVDYTVNSDELYPTNEWERNTYPTFNIKKVMDK